MVNGKVSSVMIARNFRTELVLTGLDRSLLWTDLVLNLFLNQSIAVVVVVLSTTLGGLLLLLLLFSSTLGADVSVSNTLGDGAAIAVSFLFGGGNISVNSFQAIRVFVGIFY
jgi:hypothetical protein